MKTPKACRRCGSSEPRASDGRCRACAARRKRERRVKARSEWGEHKDPAATPPGYAIKGTSTLRRANGEVVLTWEKTNREAEDRAQAIADAFEALPDKPRVLPLIKCSDKTANEDLMIVVPQGDPHFGMHAWAPEAGEDYDMAIAQRITRDAMHRLLSILPPASLLVLLNLGDFFHADNQSNTTPRTGAQLDVDSRFPKVLGLGVDLQSELLEMALARYPRVLTRNNPGNHDPHSAHWLTKCMQQRFRENDRVDVDMIPAYHWYYEFGRCLLGSTHGDAGKHKDLIELMAADQPQAWGRTEFRRWYVGHIHHEHTIEGRACTVETFRTLAPGDAWHRKSQYRAGRDIRGHVWHRDRGLVNIQPVGIVSE